MVDVRNYGNDRGSYRHCRLEIGVVGRFVRLDLRLHPCGTLPIIQVQELFGDDYCCYDW